MTRVVALLSLITVVSWGTWIPLAQAVPGVSQAARTFYVTAGNVVFAGGALAVGGGHLAWGWRGFWLPVVGGIVWTCGNYSAFRASAAIGLARAAGSWAPLNIIVAFVWGAALFGELDGLSDARFAALGGALALVVTGVLLIAGSQDARPAGAPPPGAPVTVGRKRLRTAAAATIETPTASLSVPAGPDPQADPPAPGTLAGPPAPGTLAGPRAPGTSAGRPVSAGITALGTSAAPVGTPGSATPPLPIPRKRSQHPRGLLWAVAAGVLWGSYFIPAQWAHVSAQVSNFPLALGMLVGGLALGLSGGEPVRLPATAAATNLAAGVLFGIGNLALLGLVSRVGTGVGFTIGQLSLLVNASIGIWLFKVPPPGSRAARLAVAGILIAGSGGAIIGGLR
jgi:glucose uptake protein GlcU